MKPHSIQSNIIQPNVIKPIKIRNITLGEGTPKICVPIVGKTQEDIECEAHKIVSLPVDIVEWRVDWFESSKDIERVLACATSLRNILGTIPILFTIRTSDEGGETHYTTQEYKNINIAVVASGMVDVIDVEIYRTQEVVTDIIKTAHQEQKYVIASNHDFQKTPCKDELIDRLTYMQEMGADILKIAVMPQTPEDVLVLLDATREMVEKIAVKPVVTMSMGSLGVISRFSGGTFGSAMTFGAGEKASAPGQIEACELKHILNVIESKR